MSNIIEELKTVVESLSQEELKNWAQTAASRAPDIAKRRFDTLKSDAQAAAAPAKGFGFGKGLLSGGLSKMKESADQLKQMTGTANTMAGTFKNDPKSAAPAVMGLLFALCDENAAAKYPAVAKCAKLMEDPLVGGTATETAAHSVLDIADIARSKLPAATRSPLWDELVAAKDKIAGQFASGATLTQAMGSLLKPYLADLPLPPETLKMLESLAQ